MSSRNITAALKANISHYIQQKINSVCKHECFDPNEISFRFWIIDGTYVVLMLQCTNKFVRNKVYTTFNRGVEKAFGLKPLSLVDGKCFSRASQDSNLYLSKTFSVGSSIAELKFRNKSLYLCADGGKYKRNGNKLVFVPGGKYSDLRQPFMQPTFNQWQNFLKDLQHANGGLVPSTMDEYKTAYRKAFGDDLPTLEVVEVTGVK